MDLAAEREIVRGSKPGHDRVVFLTPALIAALHRYLEKRPMQLDEERVFVLHRRSPTLRSIWQRLRKYGKEAGVDVSPHKLRHTLATRLLNQCMPIHSLQKLLGHEHINATQIYARFTTKRFIASSRRRCLTWRPTRLMPSLAPRKESTTWLRDLSRGHQVSR
jgi:integrase/recombinase XerD